MLCWSCKIHARSLPALFEENFLNSQKQRMLSASYSLRKPSNCACVSAIVTRHVFLHAFCARASSPLPLFISPDVFQMFSAPHTYTCRRARVIWTVSLYKEIAPSCLFVWTSCSLVLVSVHVLCHLNCGSFGETLAIRALIYTHPPLYT